MPIAMQNHSPIQLLLAFYLPSVLFSIAFGILAPVLPVYADELTTLYAWVGVLLAGTSIGLLIGDVLTSWSLAHFGTRRTMLIGVLIATLPIVLLFLFADLLLVIALLILSGIGQALYNVSRHQHMTAIIPTAYRGRALGLMGGVFRVGKLIGPLLGGWIGGAFGLRYAFLALGLFCVVTLYLLWRYLPAHTTEPDSATADHNPAQKLLAVVRDQRGILLSAGSGQIMAMLTRQGWLMLIPLYAAGALNLDVQTIGLVLGVSSAVDLAFFYVAGIIMDRFGRKWAIVPSFLLQGLGVALIPFSDSAVTLAIVGAIIGFANALGSGTMLAIGSDIAPHGRRGEFLSIWGLIGDTGMVFAPILIGAVAQALSLSASSLVIAGAGLGTAFLFGRFVPETLRKGSS
jgi:MFS family permease